MAARYLPFSPQAFIPQGERFNPAWWRLRQPAVRPPARVVTTGQKIVVPLPDLPLSPSAQYFLQRGRYGAAALPPAATFAGGWQKILPTNEGPPPALPFGNPIAAKHQQEVTASPAQAAAVSAAGGVMSLIEKIPWWGWLGGAGAVFLAMRGKR